MRLWTLLIMSLVMAVEFGDPREASAQYVYNNSYPSYQLNQFYYYPYHYYPHNYWPMVAPKWPEAPGQPYMRPPAYQAYPAFKEPNWRYDLWMPMRFYRGSHFWLDQF